MIIYYLVIRDQLFSKKRLKNTHTNYEKVPCTSSKARWDLNNIQHRKYICCSSITPKLSLVLRDGQWDLFLCVYIYLLCLLSQFCEALLKSY